MSNLRFVVVTVLATILLGIAIDLVTANLGVDYFLPPIHPRIVPSTSPWVLALAWGFAASWWFGLIGAVIVCAFNTRRTRPVPLRTVFRWIVRGMVAIWVAMMSIVAGVYGLTCLVPVHQRRPSFEHDRRLIAVAMAHQFEYLFGGIVVLLILVMIARRSKSASVPLKRIEDVT